MPLSLHDLQQHCSEDVVALNHDLFAGEAVLPAKGNKYHARKVEFEGMVFDSKKEYLRYRELTILQVRGEIAQLKRQVTYELQPALIDGNGKKQRAITYTADYTYQQGDKTIIEDVKSSITAKSESFRVRWRLLLAKFKDDPSIICSIYNP